MYYIRDIGYFDATGDAGSGTSVGGGRPVMRTRVMTTLQPVCAAGEQDGQQPAGDLSTRSRRFPVERTRAVTAPGRRRSRFRGSGSLGLPPGTLPPNSAVCRAVHQGPATVQQERLVPQNSWRLRVRPGTSWINRDSCVRVRNSTTRARLQRLAPAPEPAFVSAGFEIVPPLLRACSIVSPSH